MQAILLKKGESDPNSFATLVDIEGKLEDFYRLLDCSCIEMPSRLVGGKWFDIVCDEEGLFVSGNIPTCVNTSFEESIFGNTLLVHNNHGKTVGVTQEDFDLVKRNITKTIMMNARTREFKEICVLCIGYE